MSNIDACLKKCFNADYSQHSFMRVPDYGVVARGDEDYFRARSIYAPATGKVVQKVLAQHVPDGEIFELGSGFGFLVNNVLAPDDARRIQQSDADGQCVAVNRAVNPASNIVQADVHDLSVCGRKFEGVIALDLFDVVADLRQALEQISGVLKPGGKLIHVLDVMPNKGILLELFRGDDKKMPFPMSSNEDRVLDGILILDPKTALMLEAFCATFPPLLPYVPLLKEYFLRYFDDFDGLVADYHKMTPMIKALADYHKMTPMIKALADIMQGLVRTGVLRNCQYISFRDFFEEYLLGNMEQMREGARLKVLSVGMETGEASISRESAQPLLDFSSEQDVNVLDVDLGTVVVEKDPAVEEGMVKVRANLHVLVAEKKKGLWGRMRGSF